MLFNFLMNRHSLQDGVVFLQLQTVGRVFLVLRCNITGSTRHTACLMLRTFQNNLNASLFILLSHGSVCLFFCLGLQRYNFSGNKQRHVQKRSPDNETSIRASEACKQDLFLGRLDIQFNRLNQIFRSHDGIELFLGQNLLFQNQIDDTLVIFKSFLGQLGRVVVTDVGVQSRYHTDAVMNQLGATLLVGLDTVDAEGTQGVESAMQRVRKVLKAFFSKSMDSNTE